MDFFESIIQDIKNKSMNNLICGACGTSEEALQIEKLLEAFNKRGVSTETFIEAISEGMGLNSPFKAGTNSTPDPEPEAEDKCDFCDKPLYNKDGERLYLEFCPVCGRKVGG